MDQIAQGWGLERYAATLERVRRFWRGEGTDRFLVSIHSTEPAYRQAFDDAKMLAAIPAHLEAESRLPGVNLPAVFLDYGTISTAKYWGGAPRFDSTGGNIFVDPVAATLAEAEALAPLPPAHPDQDAARGLAVYHQARRLLETEHLWLRTPDMQGPLNTAGLVMNQEELLMALLSEPEAAQPFLDKVTDFLIRYQRHLQQASGQRVCGNIWPYVFLPCDLGICMTEDLMPLLGPETYRDVGLPLVRRMADAFGGLMVHCCGTYGRHVEHMAASGIPYLGLEFHPPHTTIEQLKPLWGRTVFVPGWPTPELCADLLATTPEDVRFWFPFGTVTDGAIEFAKRHGF